MFYFKHKSHYLIHMYAVCISVQFGEILVPSLFICIRPVRILGIIIMLIKLNKTFRPSLPAKQMLCQTYLVKLSLDWGVKIQDQTIVLCTRGQCSYPCLLRVFLETLFLSVVNFTFQERPSFYPFPHNDTF